MEIRDGLKTTTLYEIGYIWGGGFQLYYLASEVNIFSLKTLFFFAITVNKGADVECVFSVLLYDG